MQAAAALLTGVVVGVLDKLFGGPDKAELRALFQEFADDIVRRVTANVRDLVRNTFTSDNIRRLGASVVAMREYIALYESTDENHYLLSAEKEAINSSAEAESLGLSGLGIYMILSTAKIAIFLERNLPNHALATIDRAKDHVRGLQTQVLEGATASVGEPMQLTSGGVTSSSFDIGTLYKVPVNGQDRIFSVTSPGSGENSPIRKVRDELIAEQLQIVTQNLVTPSNTVIAQWDALRAKLSPGT